MAKPEPDYDPYGENQGRRRQSVGPRLADITRPAVGAEPPERRFEGHSIPRPHQPQKRLKPQDIVPNEDNPFGPFKRFGAHLISKNLFPMESSRNILLVYLTGKQRGRTLEDLVGLIPWIILIPTDAILYLQVFNGIEEYTSYNLIRLIPLMIFSALWSIAMVSIHMRRVLRNLPLDEMLMTRLSYDEIVQGLALRPLAVQAISVFTFFLSQFLIITFLVSSTNKLDSFTVIVLYMMIVLLYMLMSTSVELGGAMGMRAHLCIKSPVIATFKSIIDLSFLMGILFICIIVAAIISVIALTIAALVSLLGIGIVIGTAIFLSLMIGMYTFFSAFLRGEASEAMQWCYNHPKEWWIAANDESIDNVERGLFTPWRPLAERYKLKLRGDGFADEDGPKPPG